jgi:hypothetical protein
MELVYCSYYIDATLLAEGGRYYARAKISATGDAAPDPPDFGGSSTPQEVKWSGDLGQFGSQEQAAECGRDWPVGWCDRHPSAK